MGKLYLLFVPFLSTLLAVSASGQDIIKWVDPLKEGAEVYGHGWKDMRGTYNRLPAKAEGVVTPNVWRLGLNSAGLSLVFKSDAPEIRVRYQVKERQAMYHMAATGTSGIDLYVTDAEGIRHFISPIPPVSFKDTINYVYCDIFDPITLEKGKTTMSYRLNLPLYNTITWLEIGIPENAKLDFVPVGNERPIVIYGSSITQGACASRPSLSWTAILAAEIGREVVNLGFSGSGKGEKEVFDLLAEIDAEMFFIDCIPNMSMDEPIKERLLYGIRKLHETHGCPILLSEYSVCGQEGAIAEVSTDKANTKNALLREVYTQLLREGIKDLYYLSADEWGAGMDGYVEGEHPNDWGMRNLAAGATAKVREILRQIGIGS